MQENQRERRTESGEPRNLPNWLRLAWMRARKNKGHAHGVSGWAISQEINGFLTADLDHWGSSRIAGSVCFVTEPYSPAEIVLSDMNWLAAVVGGYAYVEDDTWHGFGTIRGIVSPSPIIINSRSRPMS